MDKPGPVDQAVYNGKVLAMAPSVVRQVVADMIARGTIVAVVVELEGETAVQVFDQARTEIPDILEQVARDLRAAFGGTNG